MMCSNYCPKLNALQYVCTGVGTTVCQNADERSTTTDMNFTGGVEASPQPLISVYSDSVVAFQYDTFADTAWLSAVRGSSTPAWRHAHWVRPEQSKARGPPAAQT